MEQYVDISEQAFAEKITEFDALWANADPGSEEEFTAHIACNILGYMEDKLAKTWLPSEVAAVLDLLIPALTEIRDKIQTNIK